MHKTLRAWSLLLAAVLLAQVVFAAILPVAWGQSVPGGAPARAPIMPSAPMRAPSLDSSRSIQVAPSVKVDPAPSLSVPTAPSAAPAAPAAAVVPYCDRLPDQCRPHRHASHPHPPHDPGQCACEWYDHNAKRWVAGQYARSCCR